MKRFLAAAVSIVVERFPATSVILIACLAVGLVSGPATSSGPVSFVAAAPAEPKAVVGDHVVIKGPTDVPVGGLCVVIVEGLKADDSLSWVAVPPISIADLIDRQGRPVLLVPSNLTGTYHLVLAFVDAGKVRQLTHTVKVGQPTPVPPGPTPPGPTPPGPTPPEPVPDGRLGFTKLAFDQAMKVQPPARQKAAAIADNFTGVASAIAAGAINSVGAANTEMAKKNRDVLAVQADRDAWMPFLQAWAEAADDALQAGTLKATAADYAEIYRATSDGLRRVK